MSRVILFIFLIVSWGVNAQNVTIINNYNGDDESVSEEDYVLKSVSEHTYIINEYEPSYTGERSKLQQMIRYGLRSHVDNQFHPFDGHIEILESPSDFLIAADAIVQNAIWIHDLSFYDAFGGFSDEVTAQVSAMNKIDGFEIRTGSRNRSEAISSSIGLYTFQRMVYDLKVQLEVEVNSFLDTHMPRNDEKGFDENEGQFLTDNNFQLSSYDQNEQELLDIEPVLDFEIKDKKEKRPRRNKKSDESLQFSERIVELLEENNRILANYDNRFEEIQDQIDDIKNGQPVEEDDSVKSEIAELRQMIIDMSKGETIREPDGSITSIATESVTVIFEKNAFELNMAHQAQLNIAVRELNAHPRYTALITGYADKSGNAEFNAWISKARADSVKDYLLANGVSDQRLILNFLGDAESEYSNPADRKVEVQFLQNTSSVD